MASETAARRGFAHRCITCGAEDGLRFNLGDMKTLECTRCSAELTVADVRSHLEGWTRLLSWLGSMPARDAAPREAAPAKPTTAASSPDLIRNGVLVQG